MTPVSPSPQPVPSPWSQRLVEQLQQLSEVTENLTYRLLELEERLAAGESAVAELREQTRGAGASELPETMETWLEDTEQRLGRVEELLRGGASRGTPGVGGGRPLVAVSSRPGALADGGHEEEIDPFPEEEEQAFLDEQPFLDEQIA